MDMKLSRYHVVTPRFVDEVDRQAKRIVFATRTAEMLLIDDGGWRLAEAGRFAELPDELRATLVELELLVPAGEDELKTVLDRNRLAAREDDVLPLVIQPTAFCQLGCGYCGQEHSARWLNARHQADLLARLTTKLAARPMRRLDVCWFGAEPLSGINVIRSLTPRLKALAASHGCEYSATMVTNGLALTEEVAAEIINEHEIRTLTISLDGTAEYHNARRHRKNGRPTFDTIFANVTALARREDLDATIVIRTNVDRRNCDGVLPLLRALADAGVQRRIRYYVMPIHSWGNDAHLRSLTPDEFAAREIEWFCAMTEQGFPLGIIPSLKPVVCLAVHPLGELVDANGTIFNCTEVSYVPTYGTPNRFEVGHLSGREEPEKRLLLADFNDRVERAEYPCASCRMLPVCGGACPKSWLEGQSPCPSAKYNIEERLLLSYAASRVAGEATGQSGERLSAAAAAETFDR
jgi:uncharacterized protein